jgi:hypothetical protein
MTNPTRTEWLTYRERISRGITLCRLCGQQIVDGEAYRAKPTDHTCRAHSACVEAMNREPLPGQLELF